jgi:hypothetical protein
MRKSDWMLELESIVLFHSCVASRGAVERNFPGSGRPYLPMPTRGVRVVGVARIQLDKRRWRLRPRLSRAVVRINHAGQAASGGAESAAQSNAGSRFNSIGCGDAAAEQIRWHDLCEPSASTIQFNSFSSSTWRSQRQRSPLTTDDNRDVISLGTDSDVSSGKSLEVKPVAVARLKADTNPCLSSA